MKRGREAWAGEKKFIVSIEFRTVGFVVSVLLRWLIEGGKEFKGAVEKKV